MTDGWESLSNYEAESFEAGETDGRRNASDDGCKEARITGFIRAFRIALELNVIFSACRRYMEDFNEQNHQSSTRLTCIRLIKSILDYPTEVMISYFNLEYLVLFLYCQNIPEFEFQEKFELIKTSYHRIRLKVDGPLLQRCEEVSSIEW